MCYMLLNVNQIIMNVLINSLQNVEPIKFLIYSSVCCSSVVQVWGKNGNKMDCLPVSLFLFNVKVNNSVLLHFSILQDKCH